MKALSLTQPWATLVANEAKRVETRSWSTSYRGPIAIHAAKGFPLDCQRLCSADPFHGGLDAVPAKRLPRGLILAVAEIRDVMTTEEMVRLWRSHDSGRVPNYHDDRERQFGDYGPDRFAWRLVNVRRLVEPIPCKGALGLWTVPSEIETQFRFVEAA